MDLVFLLIAGAAALTVCGFAVFGDGDNDDQSTRVTDSDVDDDADEVEESEEGELLSFADGPDVTGTVGDDTITATGDVGEADAPPNQVRLDLLGGDDFAQFSILQVASISAGSGDDTILAEAATSLYADLGAGDDRLAAGQVVVGHLFGGEGDDEITLGGDYDIGSSDGGATILTTGAVQVSGGDGDDVLNLSAGQSNLLQRVDGGDGDDVINIKSRAEIARAENFGFNDFFTVTTGEGADVLNIELQVGIVDEYAYDSNRISYNETITDFDPDADKLRVSVVEDTENAGRQIDISLVAPAESGGAYRLEFDIAANASSDAFKSVFRISSSDPLTLDDIEIVGLDPAAEGAAQSITVNSEDGARTTV